MNRLPLRVRWSQNWIGFRHLRRHLGVLGTLRFAWAVARRETRGEPWEHLSEATSEAERFCRDQIGPAILCYRELSERHPDQAFAWTREIVMATSVPWMEYALGDINRDTWEGLDADGRLQLLKKTTTRFPNMEADDHNAQPDRAHFRVTSCRLPILCKKADAPELAPLFCEVDAHYFGGVNPNLSLDRPHTIAEGASDCPFHFSWKE